MTIALTAAPLPAVAAAQAGTTCTWLGGGGNWSDASKWDCDVGDGPPGPGDTAVIDAAGGYTVTGNTDVEVADLVVGRDEHRGEESNRQVLHFGITEGRALTAASVVVHGTGEVRGGGGSTCWGLGAGNEVPLTVTGSFTVAGVIAAHSWVGDYEVLLDAPADRPRGVASVRGRSIATSFEVAHGSLRLLPQCLRAEGEGTFGAPALIVDEPLEIGPDGVAQVYAINVAVGPTCCYTIDGQPALQAPSLVNQGLIHTRSLENGGDPTFTYALDAVVDNQGVMELVRMGLDLVGEERTHTNSGTILVGAVHPSTGEVETGGPLRLLDAGASLVNTGLIDIHAERRAIAGAGTTVVNDGTITSDHEIDAAGPVELGFDGDPSATVDITELGGLSRITTTDVAEDHADADVLTASGRHWVLDPEGTGYTLDLTLPHDEGPGDDGVYACRYVGGMWDCAADARDATTVTRTGLTELSDWALGVEPEATPTPTPTPTPDPDPTPTPTPDPDPTPTPTPDPDPTPTPSPTPTPTPDPDPSADLWVTKTPDADEVEIGGLVRFALRVGNDGPYTATGVVVTDTLPAGLAFADTAPPGACSHDDGVVTCPIGDLGAGDDASVQVTVTAVAAGTQANTAAVTADTGDPDATNNAAATDVEVVAGAPSERVAGATRIETAVEATRTTFDDEEAQAVVLARADLFPDALAGTPLAVALQSPLLLTQPASLHPATEAELTRVLPASGTVHLLGGPVALDEAVADRIRELGFAVVRHSGPDRYATAARIADAVPDPQAVYLATGQDFPDALTAGAAAAFEQGVILLTIGSRMPEPTQAWIDTHADLPRHAAGGPAAGADADAAPLVGADRFETAAIVAANTFGATSIVGVATGTDFADALAGAAHIGRRSGPMLLAHPSLLPDATAEYLRARADVIEMAFVYGGPSALSDAVEAATVAAITPD